LEHSDGQDFTLLYPDESFQQMNAYGMFILKRNPFTFNLGTRVSMNHNLEDWLSIVEPRISVDFKSSQNSVINLNYARMSQPVHTLINPGVGFPLNLPFLYTSEFLIESSHTLGLSYSREIEFKETIVYLHTEVFGRIINNIITYKDGYSTTSLIESAGNSRSIDEILTIGDGNSFGIETYVDFQIKGIHTIIAYTYSRQYHKFLELNGNNWFPGVFDTPHAIDITLDSYIGKRKLYKLTANWQFRSGFPYTEVSTAYPILNWGFDHDLDYFFFEDYPTMLHYKDRNAARSRSRHTLNLNFEREILLNHDRKSGRLRIGAYNAYFRKNPLYNHVNVQIADMRPPVDAVETGTDVLVYQLREVSLFPIIPYLGFQMEF
jgi:hypothetical protein